MHVVFEDGRADVHQAPLTQIRRYPEEGLTAICFWGHPPKDGCSSLSTTEVDGLTSAVMHGFDAVHLFVYPPQAFDNLPEGVILRDATLSGISWETASCLLSKEVTMETISVLVRIAIAATVGGVVYDLEMLMVNRAPHYEFVSTLLEDTTGTSDSSQESQIANNGWDGRRQVSAPIGVLPRSRFARGLLEMTDRLTADAAALHPNHNRSAIMDNVQNLVISLDMGDCLLPPIAFGVHTCSGTMDRSRMHNGTRLANMYEAVRVRDIIGMRQSPSQQLPFFLKALASAPALAPRSIVNAAQLTIRGILAGGDVDHTCEFFDHWKKMKENSNALCVSTTQLYKNKDGSEPRGLFWPASKAWPEGEYLTVYAGTLVREMETKPQLTNYLLHYRNDGSSDFAYIDGSPWGGENADEMPTTHLGCLANKPNWGNPTCTIEWIKGATLLPAQMRKILQENRNSVVLFNMLPAVPVLKCNRLGKHVVGGSVGTREVTVKYDIAALESESGWATLELTPSSERDDLARFHDPLNRLQDQWAQKGEDEEIPHVVKDCLKAWMDKPGETSFRILEDSIQTLVLVTNTSQANAITALGVLALYSQRMSTRAYLVAMYVEPAKRNLGLGSITMKRICAYLDEKDYYASLPLASCVNTLLSNEVAKAPSIYKANEWQLPEKPDKGRDVHQVIFRQPGGNRSGYMTRGQKKH